MGSVSPSKQFPEAESPEALRERLRWELWGLKDVGV